MEAFLSLFIIFFKKIPLIWGQSGFILWFFVVFPYNFPCVLITNRSLYLDTPIVLIIFVELRTLKQIYPTCHIFHMALIQICWACKNFDPNLLENMVNREIQTITKENKIREN